MTTSLKGHFLIATPALNGSYFHHSVIYLCEHDDEGAMGLVINQPADIMLDELLAQVNIENNTPSTASTPILLGGPMQQNQGIILHDSPNNTEISSQISDGIYLSASTDLLRILGTEHSPMHSLIALGYSGWGAGQLEQEIVENSWLTTAADNDVLFNTPSEQCWHAAAELLGIDINLISATVGHA
ncbi:MAG: YqgE/AlgH family protein [Methylophaga sp.]|nr:MAG: YqgE/AlgH family protein [Methylophaga sp.]